MLMLRITNEAATVLTEVRSASGYPETYGFRVYADRSTQGPEIGFGFAAVPAEGDEVSEQEGVRIFVAPEVAEPLSESVIDVAKGGDTTRLVLRKPEAQ
jgi:Fe-S cluster assembly iron-binding protein IscA